MSSKKVITCGFVLIKENAPRVAKSSVESVWQLSVYAKTRILTTTKWIWRGKSPSTFIGSKTLSRLEAITVTYNVYKFESARACIRPCLKTQLSRQVVLRARRVPLLLLIGYKRSKVQTSWCVAGSEDQSIRSLVAIVTFEFHGHFLDLVEIHRVVENYCGLNLHPFTERWEILKQWRCFLWDKQNSRTIPVLFMVETSRRCIPSVATCSKSRVDRLEIDHTCLELE